MGFAYANPLQLIGKPEVGSPGYKGECAALVQTLVPGLGVRVAHWKRGRRVRGAALPPGTAIAIFDSNGDYIGTKVHAHKGGLAHAALYVRQSAEGVEIVHQYRGCGHVRGALVRFGGRRDDGHRSGVSSAGRHTPEDDADNYYVIEKA